MGKRVYVEEHAHAPLFRADKHVLRAVVPGQSLVDLRVRVRRAEVVEGSDVRVRRHRDKGVGQNVHFRAVKSERKGNRARPLGIVHEGKGGGKIVRGQGSFFLDVAAHEGAPAKGVQIPPVIGEKPGCPAELRHVVQRGGRVEKGVPVVAVHVPVARHDVQGAVQVGGNVRRGDAEVARVFAFVGAVLQGIGIGHPAVCGKEKFPVRIGNAADIRNIGGSRLCVALVAFHIESENARTVHGKRFFSRADAGGGIREFQGRASRFFDAQHSVGRGVRQKDGFPVHGNVRGVLGKPVHAVAVTRDLVACKLFAVRVKGADAVFVNEINAPRIADPREFVPVHAFHAKIGIAALPIEVSLHGKIETSEAEEKANMILHTMTGEEGATNERLFYHFFSLPLKGDMDFLNNLEEEISNNEDKVLSGDKASYLKYITAWRQELLRLKRYYEQLNFIFDEMTVNDNQLFSEDGVRRLMTLRNRTDRYLSAVKNLQEMVSQLREAYQSQLAIEQNDLMKIFTVVTVIFLPLSLLAGWYGMNFSHIPELKWKYGYPLVILVSIVTVAALIWKFKKKKWL